MIRKILLKRLIIIIIICIIFFSFKMYFYNL